MLQFNSSCSPLCTILTDPLSRPLIMNPSENWGQYSDMFYLASIMFFKKKERNTHAFRRGTHSQVHNSPRSSFYLVLHSFTICLLVCLFLFLFFKPCLQTPEDIWICHLWFRTSSDLSVLLLVFPLSLSIKVGECEAD